MTAMCVYASLKMLIRHYLPKVVEKLRSTLVCCREAGINQQILALAMPHVYTNKIHMFILPRTHTHSHILMDVYRIRGSRYIAVRVRNIYNMYMKLNNNICVLFAVVAYVHTLRKLTVHTSHKLLPPPLQHPISRKNLISVLHGPCAIYLR